MNLRGVGRFVLVALPILLWAGCGQVYRPVVIPCTTGGIPGCPTEQPPSPANFHEVFGISNNVPTSPGGALQIDVSGDTIIGETPTSQIDSTNLGDIPTYGTILPNDTKVFVVSAGSLVAGGLDVVSSFAPATQGRIATGFGPVNNLTLPSGSLPVFVNTTESGFVYVANFGSNSVSAVNVLTNQVANTAAVGTNPVALAEATIAGGNKLYVANQGSNSISSLNTLDLSLNAVNGFTGNTPVWAVSRVDGQKVYVVTQGDGQLVTIDTASDTVTSSIPLGGGAPGANYIAYDSNLGRLYVVNPVTGIVYVFSDTGGLSGGVVSDIPNQLAAISFPLASSLCPSGCSAVIPTAVAALPDGSRFYVASYQLASSCPDSFVGASPCIIPQLTVFDALNFTPEYSTASTLKLLTYPPFQATPAANPTQYQYAVPQVSTCGPATPPLATTLYSPGTTRFRVFTTASEDGSRVYVSMCDAGGIAVINTTASNTNNPLGGTPADTLVTDLMAAPQPTGMAPQNPILLFIGQ
jgi:YVTN family beta-propeller protein